MTWYDNLDPDLAQQVEWEIAALTGHRGALVDFKIGGPEELTAIDSAIAILSGDSCPADYTPAALKLIPDPLLKLVKRWCDGA
jgi:hypothetical protein